MLNPAPSYQTKQEQVEVTGVCALTIRLLLDRQQFCDPYGDAESQGISSAAWPLFGLLWPSGAQLAAQLAARAVRPGERVLEVGCGLALASLVGHRLGADMTASDCHPLTEAFLLENLRLNALAPMKYRHGHWAGRPLPAGRDGALPALAVQGPFDFIIGSDLLYEPDVGSSLAGFIGRHAHSVAEVWIVDPDRAHRSAFHRAMATFGFAVSEVRLDRPATASAAAYKGRLLTYTRRSRAPLLAA